MVAEMFVDTSAWFALTDRATPGHRAVESALRDRLQKGTVLVTTNLVIAETHVLLLRRTTQRVALAFVREVGRPPNAIVTSIHDLEHAAVRDWLERYADQPFSFTDAVSFSVMRARRISEALTLDHHFAVAGFAVVPARA
ncbi:MAG: type II toxin-antitoxin system VapC family toxin [Gemmatimonadales bacterium]